MITILDVVKAAVGSKDSYSWEDHEAVGVAMMGGCAGCHATLASYNAYPSQDGFWGCGDCLPLDRGFATVEAFLEAFPRGE